MAKKVAKMEAGVKNGVKVKKIRRAEMDEMVKGLPDWTKEERKELAKKYRGYKYAVDGKRVDRLIFKIKEDGVSQWFLYYLLYRECGKGKRTQYCSKVVAAACVDKTGRYGIWISDEIEGMKIAYLHPGCCFRYGYGWNYYDKREFFNSKDLEIDCLDALKYICMREWKFIRISLAMENGELMITEDGNTYNLKKDRDKILRKYLDGILRNYLDRTLLYLEYPQTEFIFKFKNPYLREWMLEKLLAIKNEKRPDLNLLKELIAMFRLCIKHKNPFFDPNMDYSDHNTNWYRDNSRNRQNLSLWFDYIIGLWKLKKDLRNPSNFNFSQGNWNSELDRLSRAHDEAMQRLRLQEFRKYRELQHKKLIKKAAEQKEEFLRMKEKFIGLVLEDDDDLKVMTLDSPEEYVEESNAMHNCIGVLKYYMKENSLILVARKGEERIADIELDLRYYRILQCFGPCNQKTVYEDRIRKLIYDNLDEIKRRNRRA